MGQQYKDSQATIYFKFKNALDERRRVVIEPWAEEHILERGDTILIEFLNTEGEYDAELCDYGLIVYAPQECDVTTKINGTIVSCL